MADFQGELFQECKELPCRHVLAANFVEAKPTECRRTAETFNRFGWTADQVCAILLETKGVTKANIDIVRMKVRRAFAMIRKRALEKPEQHAISL